MDRTAGLARCDGRLTNTRCHPGQTPSGVRGATRGTGRRRCCRLACCEGGVPLPHSLASFVCPGCPGSRWGLRPYRPSAQTLLNAAPTPSLTGATRFLGRRVSHVSHVLLRTSSPLCSVIRISSAKHLTGVAGFPRPKIPKRLKYALITSSHMASSRRAWL